MKIQHFAVLATLVLCGAHAQEPAPSITAIDILLEPDATMLKHAESNNARLLAAANVNAMKLEAFKYYYAPAGPLGVAGICAKPTPEILKLQADIIAAVKPFTVET